jgi:hypothetical protein
MNIQNGTHKILFSKGKLYLDGSQIAGDGILPEKDVVFEFQVNIPETVVAAPKDPSILEVNVHDSIATKALGPGQI